jgi:hypothetical protein
MHLTHFLLSRLPFRLALFALSLCTFASAQNTVISVISGVNDDSAQSLSNDAKYPADTIFGALKLKQNWGFWYATEIDSNCKVVSTGKFTPSNGPHYGDLSYKVVPHTIPTGTCKGKKVDYNLATYVWTKTTAAEPQDFFHIQWQTPDGSNAALDMLPELIPTGEKTVFRAWDGGDPTVAYWRVQLQPDTVKYDGVTVRETAPFTQTESCSGTGFREKCQPDTCWWGKSPYDPQIAISDPNGNVHIPVENGNHWNDKVGWGSGLVEGYRNRGRAPCGTTYPQQMQIQFATGDPNWYNYGPVNTLGGSFTFTDDQVTSTRAGESKTETWPAQ